MPSFRGVIDLEVRQLGHYMCRVADLHWDAMSEGCLLFALNGILGDNQQQWRCI